MRFGDGDAGEFALGEAGQPPAAAVACGVVSEESAVPEADCVA